MNINFEKKQSLQHGRNKNFNNCCGIYFSSLIAWVYFSSQSQRVLEKVSEIFFQVCDTTEVQSLQGISVACSTHAPHHHHHRERASCWNTATFTVRCHCSRSWARLNTVCLVHSDLSRCFASMTIWVSRYAAVYMYTTYIESTLNKRHFSDVPIRQMKFFIHLFFY